MIETATKKCPVSFDQLETDKKIARQRMENSDQLIQVIRTETTTRNPTKSLQQLSHTHAQHKKMIRQSPMSSRGAHCQGIEEVGQHTCSCSESEVFRSDDTFSSSSEMLTWAMSSFSERLASLDFNAETTASRALSASSALASIARTVHTSRSDSSTCAQHPMCHHRIG
jgi:hypothetical protein